MLQATAGARAYRRLQPFVLRGSAGGARASGASRKAEAAAETPRQAHLGGTVRRHPQFRAVSEPQRRACAQILSARLQEGAAQTVPRADRQRAEELEVLRIGLRRTKVLGDRKSTRL